MKNKSKVRRDEWIITCIIREDEKSEETNAGNNEPEIRDRSH